MRPSRRPWPVIVLAVMLVLLAIGALPAGFGFLRDPTGGKMGIGADALAGSPFRSYLIPGLFLVLVFGVWSLILTYGLLRRPHWPWFDLLTGWTREHWAWGFSVVQGAALMIWIVVQVAVIGSTSFLQPFYFVYGIILIALCLPAAVRRYYAVAVTGGLPAS